MEPAHRPSSTPVVINGRTTSRLHFWSAAVLLPGWLGLLAAGATVVAWSSFTASPPPPAAAVAAGLLTLLASLVLVPRLTDVAIVFDGGRVGFVPLRGPTCWHRREDVHFTVRVPRSGGGGWSRHWTWRVIARARGEWRAHHTSLMGAVEPRSAYERLREHAPGLTEVLTRW